MLHIVKKIKEKPKILFIYNRENDLYKFSKRNVHFSPFFRGSSSSLEYHLKGF